jgi:hypothetical protein
MTVTRGDGEPELVEVPMEGNGMNYEAAAVMDCLRQGKLEHELMPLDESVRIAETMDELRAQWALTYPQEEAEEGQRR